MILYLEHCRIHIKNNGKHELRRANKHTNLAFCYRLKLSFTIHKQKYFTKRRVYNTRGTLSHKEFKTIHSLIYGKKKWRTLPEQ